MVGNNLGRLGKPASQLELAGMPVYISEKPAGQKYWAVFQAEKYINPGSKMSSSELKEIFHSKFCLGFY